jgi:hypothetical protein
MPPDRYKADKELQERVLAYLRDRPHGGHLAVRMRSLASMMHCEERKVRDAISQLRKRGYPICTSVREPAGAFWPATEKEFTACLYGQLRARRLELERIEEAMETGWYRLSQGLEVEEELQPALLGEVNP